jgi:hypothetical protein
MMRPAASAAGVGTFAFRDSHLTPPIDRGPRARLWPNQGTIHCDAANEQSYATCVISVKPRWYEPAGSRYSGRCDRMERNGLTRCHFRRALPKGVTLAVFDFRRNSKVPNYLGSKQQRRLLVILALVGVLAIGVFQARDLGRGSWFASTGPGGGAESAGQSAAGLAAATNNPPGSATDEDGSSAPQGEATLFPGVRPDYLSTVKDDTVFRAVESDAWFHLLALLEKTDQRDLKRASLGRVDFLQLDQQADQYRGKLVSINGTLRGAKLVAAPANGYSIKRYYQLWLQPDRGSPALMAVYALALPEGFPLGTDLEVPCAATGFFFKRWAYPSREGIATAPLVLARTVDWHPPLPAAPAAPPAEQFVWALLIALFLAVMIVGFFIARGRAARGPRPPAADGEKLQAVLLSREIAHQVDRGDVAGDKT